MASWDEGFRESQARDYKCDTNGRPLAPCPLPASGVSVILDMIAN